MHERVRESLSADATVIALLCATLGRTSAQAKPLTALMYHDLAAWLHANDHRPSDLLGVERDAILDARGNLSELRRLRQLLDGGFALGMRIESWNRVGGWILTRADPMYPSRLRRLAEHRPPILFGLGSQKLLEREGLAVVGSRDIESDDEQFTAAVAANAASSGLTVISGGARGVDTIAMQSALSANGTVVGVLADRLSDAAERPEWRSAILRGDLCLVSPWDPDTRFSAGNAMARNKVIYALAEAALVVRTSIRTGGTWAGAVENLKHRWVPTFVRDPSEIARLAGNRELMKLGAHVASADPTSGWVVGEMRRFWLSNIENGRREDSNLFDADGTQS